MTDKTDKANAEADADADADANNVGGSSVGALPIGAVQNVIDAVSEKVTTHTKGIITKAKNSLSVLRKFPSPPEEEVDEQESQEVDDDEVEY